MYKNLTKIVDNKSYLFQESGDSLKKFKPELDMDFIAKMSSMMSRVEAIEKKFDVFAKMTQLLERVEALEKKFEVDTDMLSKMASMMQQMESFGDDMTDVQRQLSKQCMIFNVSVFFHSHRHPIWP